MTPASRPPSLFSHERTSKRSHPLPHTPPGAPLQRGQHRAVRAPVAPGYRPPPEEGPAVLGCLGLPGPESASRSEAGMRQSCRIWVQRLFFFWSRSRWDLGSLTGIEPAPRAVKGRSFGHRASLLRCLVSKLATKPLPFRSPGESSSCCLNSHSETK